MVEYYGLWVYLIKSIINLQCRTQQVGSDIQQIRFNVGESMYLKMKFISRNN